MKRILRLALLQLSLVTAGCEVFTIGTPPVEYKILPDLDQRSAEGVVYLFKAEIDNLNLDAASFVLAQKEDTPLLALEKYEMQFEVARVGRMIRGTEITEMIVDTVSTAQRHITTEFNYITQLTFTTVKLDDRWFISSIAD